MKFLKSFITLVLISIFSVSGLSAMPGFSSYIKDSSGEFVYYRDYSFTEETYIGILYYAEDSIQIRYYRPLNKEKQIPEKEISILFSINPDIDYLEFTGELIMSTIIPDSDDLDIVNYLHDILYEFSSRRIKEGNVLPVNNPYTSNFLTTGKKSTQNYEQFGGTVTIIYDSLIPIFNIKSITNNKDEPVLTCVTFGTLQNSADSTFDQFTGFPANTTKTENKKSSINKNMRASDYATADGQFVSLDSNWTQAMDNLWLCGNESLLTINSIPPMNEADNYDFAVIRKLLQSSNGSYTNLLGCEILKDTKKDAYKITQASFQPKTENQIINKKIITRNPKTKGFYYFALTVFAEYYYPNSSYYDKIIKSYKIKN